jgi:peptidoglycan hydrolase-like protein with peptidoglycan-binding domain
MSIQSALALSCIDLPSNLKQGKENSQVLLLQNFLYEKGLLKAKPNGYYGGGTSAAVKAYQKSKGLTRSGDTFPITRQAIKSDTCEGSVVQKTSQASTVASNAITSSVQKVATTTSGIKLPQLAIKPSLDSIEGRNAKRLEDVTTILKAMYLYYYENSHRIPVGATTTDQEICILNLDLCDGFADFSSLTPGYLQRIPIAPSYASGTGAGYTITRSQEINGNIITIKAKNSENGVEIKASCNFDDQCKKPTEKPSNFNQTPSISSIDVATYIVNGSSTSPLTIRGVGFSSTTNYVLLRPFGSVRTYTAGPYTSFDGATILASTTFTEFPISCGVGCSERLEPGKYQISVKNSNGESLGAFITISGFTTKSIPNSPDQSFLPKSTHVKLATITVSSQVNAQLMSIGFALNGTTTLVKKISKFTLTDTSDGVITNNGPEFTFTNVILRENQSKSYELYADIDEIESWYAGQITVNGAVQIKPYIGGNIVSIPLEPFMFSISY